MCPLPGSDVSVGMEMTHVTPDSRGRALDNDQLWLSENEIRLFESVEEMFQIQARPGWDVSMWRQTLGPHALELTCGNTVEAFSVNDPLIFAEGFYITSEGTSAGEQLAVIILEKNLVWK